MFYPTTCVGFRYGPPSAQTRGADFLGSLLLVRLSLVASHSCTVGFRSRRFLRRLRYRLQRTIPSVRTHFAPPSPLPLAQAGLRNIDRMSIHIPCQGCVRSRLTLNRLALFRNPWSFGEGVSRPLCRYLYLHLLFRFLQHISRYAFTGGGMLPYQHTFTYIPRLRHRTYARLLSMRGRSTSELLRTL